MSAARPRRATRDRVQAGTAVLSLSRCEVACEGATGHGPLQAVLLAACSRQRVEALAQEGQCTIVLRTSRRAAPTGQGHEAGRGQGSCSEPSTWPLRTVPTDTHGDPQPVQALSSAGSPSAASLLPGSVCHRAEAGGWGHVGAQLCSFPAPQGKGWRPGPGLGSRGSALSLACVPSDSGFQASASPCCPAFFPAVLGAPGRTLTQPCLPAAHEGL